MRNRKIIITVAFACFTLSMINVVYWIYYWNRNEALVKSNYKLFISNYVSSIPLGIRPLFPFWSVVIGFLLFLASGLLFLHLKKGLYSTLGIFSLAMAGWHLFTLL